MLLILISNDDLILQNVSIILNITIHKKNYPNIKMILKYIIFGLIYNLFY